MNPEKFTHKSNAALAGGHELALNAGHAQYTPVHLAVALISDAGGLFRQAVLNVAGSNEAVNSFERVLRQSLKKIPAQDPPPDEVPANTALVKCLRRAQTAQKKRGDSHLAVDQLILGLIEDSQVADCMKEAGVAVARVKSEIEKLRGE
eukprot:c46_g1_i1 orf=1-444(-)